MIQGLGQEIMMGPQSTSLPQVLWGAGSLRRLPEGPAPPSPQGRPLLLPLHEQLLYLQQQQWQGQKEGQPAHQQPGPVQGMLPATQQEREHQQCRAVVLPVLLVRPTPRTPRPERSPWPFLEGLTSSWTQRHFLFAPEQQQREAEEGAGICNPRHSNPKPIALHSNLLQR